MKQYLQEFIRTRVIEVDRQRIVLMMIGILGMGAMLSFLLRVNFGSDPCSYMNSALAGWSGISFGTTVLIVNIILFIPELIRGRDMIGLGTLANMLLIGYISDFCTWLQRLFLPDVWFETMSTRVLIFVLALIPFLIFVGLYINADVGVAPYDAIPTMVSRATRLPYAPVRIAHDFLAIGIALLAGKPLAIASPILALTLGPTVQAVGGFIGRLLRRDHSANE